LVNKRQNIRIPQSVPALQGKKKINCIDIVSNLFKKMNVYFIHDEDEQATVGEYVIFYGFHGMCLLLTFIFLIKIITF